MFAKIFKVALGLLPQHDHGQPAAYQAQQQPKAQKSVGLLGTAESAAPEQEGKAGEHWQQDMKEPAGEPGQRRQHKAQGNRNGCARLLPAVAQTGQ